MALQKTRKHKKITGMPSGISANYKEITDQVKSEVSIAFDANGVAGWNEFFRECVRTFHAQTRDGSLIAWPPEFLVQDRSNNQLVKLRWSTAKERQQNHK